MKKLGLGRKDKPGPDSTAGMNEDSKRSHLFGGRSKNKAPAAPANNPYAVPADGPAAQDPYAARPPPSISGASTSTYGGMGSPAYPDSGRASVATQPPPYEKASSGYGGPPPQQRGGPSPKAYGGPGGPPGGAYGGPGGLGGPSGGGYGGHGGPPGGGYGAPPPQQQRYGNQGYGNMSGYGADPYGSSKSPAPGPQRSGGYGGMGGPSSERDPATSERRNELFGGARERIEEKYQAQGPTDHGQSAYGGGASGIPDSLEGGGYGTYEDRQLTAEEQEEEDVKATKDEIRAIKREDVSLTRNALRIAAQAEESGMATLARLGAQGERLHNTEKNLDLAGIQNRIAEEKVRDLKHYTRPMLQPAMKNPFTKKKREAEMEQAILENHQTDRRVREAQRQSEWTSSNRQAEAQRELSRRPPDSAPKRINLAETALYQFEASDDEEGQDQEINKNLDEIEGVVHNLNKLGRMMGEEVDDQNKLIYRLGGKADTVSDKIATNSARLNTFK